MMRYRLGAKFKTPLTIRLEREYADLIRLKNESNILDFKASGDPPDRYIFAFHGRSLVPARGEDGVKIGDLQEVEITLGTNYPRVRPQVHWLTPIIHPNISGGNVCMGNFAANWSPSFRLADIIEILWDMARLAIFNPHSAYSSGAHMTWQQLDKKYGFPVDKRPLRDKAIANDAGSSMLRPEGKPNDIVILNDSESECQFLE